MVYGPELPASTIYEWCKSWPQTLDGRHLGRAHRWSIVRILETVADRVARSGGHGRPWIWRLRNSQLHADATQPIDMRRISDGSLATVSLKSAQKLKKGGDAIDQTTRLDAGVTSPRSYEGA